MSRSRGPGLLFQTQNLEIHDEGYAVKKTNENTSRTSQKKAGGNFGVTRKPLQNISNSGVVHTQNLDIHKEGLTVKKTSDGFSRTSQKKVGSNRKALQDLSNSISIRQDAARKKNNISREESDVAEERVLHNSKQCASSRKAEFDQNTYDAFLFEHGLLHSEKSPLPKESQEDSRVSPRKYLQLEPIPELPISAKTDWCPSPIQLDSPSHSASLYELPELKKSVPRAHKDELSLPTHNSEKGPADEKTTNLVSNASEEIPNSSSVCQVTATSKLTEEVHEIEGFLHDHNKCIEAQKAQMDHDLYYDVLFEHGLLNPVASPEAKETIAVACDSPPRYLEFEEIPELSMSPISNWCPSPIRSFSPPFSPSRYELPELVLKASLDD